MTHLSGPKPAAPAAGQAHIDDNARKLLAAVEDAMRTPTSYRDDTPVPRIGATPPVPQPGRPAMSERATDASVMMIAGGFLSLCLGAAVSAILHFSGNANETVVITVCAAPPVAFLALKSLIKGVKSAATPEINNHTYTGPVYQDQRNVQNKNIGAWVKNTNQ